MEDGRQLRCQPCALRGTELARRHVGGQQRVEEHEPQAAASRVIVCLLASAGGAAAWREGPPEVLPMVVVAENQAGRHLRQDGRHHLVQARVVLGQALQACQIAADQRAIGRRGSTCGTTFARLSTGEKPR